MALRIVIFGWASSVHVQRWARGLTDRGLAVKVVSLGGEPIEGIKTAIIPRSSRLSYFTQTNTAAAEAQEFGPDIVHAHYATGFGWWGLKSGIRPLLISVWGADVIDFVKNPLAAWFVRRLLSGADHITATSRLLEASCLKLNANLIDKIDVIPFGIRIPETVTPLPSSVPYKLCFIKGHRRKYGPDILLEAFAMAKEQVSDMQLTMAGEGEMTGQLETQASGLGLSNDVRFVGFIDNKEIYHLLGQHHLMVMPSTMESESFGVAALEASACGLPVVASRVGGIPEVVRDGVTGFLVPPGDVAALAEAIVKLARDPMRGQLMGEAGREFARQHYDWEKSLDKMITLYQVLVDGKK